MGPKNAIEPAPEPAGPAAPPPKKKKPKKPKYKTLAEVLAVTPEGVTYLGTTRDGTRTLGQIWQGHFTHIENLAEELRAAWDHSARRKRSDMVLYLQVWLRGSNDRARDAWARRPENRPRFDEARGRRPADALVGSEDGISATDRLLADHRRMAEASASPEAAEAAREALNKMRTKVAGS